MQKKTKINWVLDPGKCLSKVDAVMLIRTAKLSAEKALLKGYRIAYRDYFVINLALSTGLRVMEIAQLNYSDLFLEDKPFFILVRNGKGNKSRLVQISQQFKKHCLQYLSWKESIGESIEPSAPLILSSNTKGHMSTRVLQNVFKKVAAKADLAPNYSIHCLRHTYACMLYKASNYNLRLVQKQLGHASIKTTQVYADVMAPDMTKAVEKLWE
ncbi:MAG: tyrosine-type recombinase/integrase [Sedimentisphaerales bacterium]|nr:tyrosine-type recombinase/integrase [Sedimentisphaerales bacterium]